MEQNNNFQEVLMSKEYIKPAFTFLSPLQILSPVLDIFEDNYTGFGTHPVSIGDEGQTLTSYGRVGCIKHYEVDNELSYQIGFIYSLETGKPFIKVFSGINVKVCSNMAVFNALHSQTIYINANGFQPAYDLVREFITNQHSNCIKAQVIIDNMKNNSMTSANLNTFIGHICRSFSAARNIAGTNCIMHACTLFEDKESMYYMKPKESLNCWTIYNAITEYFGKKNHIIEHPDKVLSIYKEMEKFTHSTKLLN